MDPAAWFGLFGGGSLILAIGIAIGVSRSRGKEIDALDGRVHKLSNRMNAYPERPDDVYARKETIAAELNAIRTSLARIEAHQELMSSRLLSGGAS